MGISDRRAPYVFQISLNENNATYDIYAVTYEPKNMYFIKSDLVRNVHRVFKEAGISLTSVQFVSLEETKKELYKALFVLRKYSGFFHTFFNDAVSTLYIV